MKNLIVLLFFVIFINSCKEKPDVQQEVPKPSPTSSPSPVQVGERLPIKLKPVFVFDDNCKSVPLDFDIYFLNFEADAKCINKYKSAGKIVIAYLNAGAAEDWRSDWKELSKFCNKDYAGWPGECWLDIKKPRVLEIMKDRINQIKERGFHGHYYDNSSVHNDGKDVKLSDSIQYFTALATYSKSLGLLNGPNAGEEMIQKTIGLFDFYMTEDFMNYDHIKNYKDVHGIYPHFDIVYSSKLCYEVPNVNTIYVKGLKYSKFKKLCTKYDTDKTNKIVVTPTATVPAPNQIGFKKVGNLPNGINEASGMVYSDFHRSFIIHNDGSEGILYVVDRKGTLVKKHKTGLKFSDFEDIALYKSELYLADIGDNSESRKEKVIHVVKESDFSFVRTIKIKLDRPFNAEGIAVKEDGIWISEKVYDKRPSKLFNYDGTKLEMIKTLPMNLIGDIDFNSKGQMLIIEVGASKAYVDLDSFKVKKLGQEEAACWIDDKTFAYTSEGDRAEIIEVSL